MEFLATSIPAEALRAAVGDNVRRALAEDLGAGADAAGDVSAALIDPATTAKAVAISRDPGVFCGRPWVAEACRQVDERIRVDFAVTDGGAVNAGDALFTLSGPAASLLTVERTALNFVQLLSGTATVTRHYVSLIEHTGARLLDTRKTLPGLRLAQKYAVACGGGHNHRLGLYDQFLIKENHIAAAGGITAAIERARALDPGLKVEVEVETLDQLKEAIAAGADIAMVDNFTLEETRKAVQIAGGRIVLESSGGISENTITDIAEAGVDYISVGSLTKEVKPLDLSMRMNPL